MRIELHPSFRKAYRKRIASNKNLVKRTEERLLLFQKNPNDPILRDHQLKGAKRKFRSFAITGDIRIVYLLTSKDHAILFDIGAHNQVY